MPLVDIKVGVQYRNGGVADGEDFLRDIFGFFEASSLPTWKISHFGISTIGEIVGGFA